eukprot:TRINITY_DN5316_c0_g1_i2.p1 TRINITY_DN5316_c0_g1~~TRINITY_DN5316_c0_g1_i2.p1  ORF type:complete len:291 (-),score=30.15 TRINITY_DN5316_c0_g1_i2:544-1416(-)
MAQSLGEEKEFSGEKYLGQLLQLDDGRLMKHGHGVSHGNGTSYEGEYCYDMRHGKGTQKFSNGACYTGDWVDDMQHGQGEYRSRSGDVYVGSFVEDRKSGHGKFTWADGDYYEGEWKNGTKHGLGVLVWIDGERYEGNMERGFYNGYGKYTWPDGHCYEGNFKFDQYDGEGRVKLPTGEVFQARFQNHMCVAKLDTNGQDVLLSQLSAAIQHQQCTARVTGRFAVHQEYFLCRTCWPEAEATDWGQEGCCLACAESCHEGHDLERQPAGKFRCWCGCGLAPNSCSKNPFS